MEEWEKYETIDIDNTLLQSIFVNSEDFIKQEIKYKIKLSGKAELISTEYNR